MAQALVRPDARAELYEHAAYIARDNQDAALRFLTAAEKNFDDLAAMRGLGPVYGLTAPDLADVRFYPITGFRNYLIFYRRNQDGVEIIRILHGARNIPAHIK